MKTSTIEIPDDLAHSAGASDEDVARNARLVLASSGTTGASSPRARGRSSPD